MNHIIIGINPGKTSALACISLDGKVLLLASSKNDGAEWFVEFAKNAGSPVMVACDKKRSTHMASKLASIFDAIIFNPSLDINLVRKRELARGITTGNFHERNALVSALNAYKRFENKLNQAGRYAQENLADNDLIKTMVLKNIPCMKQ